MRWSKLTLPATAAALVYFFDPDSGPRRRLRAREKANHQAHSLLNFLDVAQRDVKNRVQGIGAEARYRFFGQRVKDDVLEQRVAAKVGRYVSHPRAIAIASDDGVITLSGVVLKSEVPRLLSAVRGIPGVHSIRNLLDEYDKPGNVPELQGGKERKGHLPELLQENWSPTLRLFAFLGASSFFIRSRNASRLLRPFATLASIAIASRAITNKPLRTVSGLDRDREAIEINKHVIIHAPIQRVFNFFRQYEQFPHFMRNVFDVRMVEEDRIRWIVRGPMGTHVSWQAQEVSVEENDSIQWQSMDGALVPQTGILEFHPEDQDTTRVTLTMSYNPPLGFMGHALARLTRCDPKTLFDEDFARAKTYLEHGKAARDAAMPESA